MLDCLVEVLDEGDEDRRRFAREHQRFDRRHLAAQPIEGGRPIPGHRFDCLHAFEYAATPDCKAIVKALWVGGDVMVVANDISDNRGDDAVRQLNSKVP